MDPVHRALPGERVAEALLVGPDEDHRGNALRSEAPYFGLTVVIPTRNRPEFALTALQSALNQLPAEAHVVLSDNSSAADRATLKERCKELDDASFHHIAPTEDLAMSAHWQWALDQALQLTGPSHVCFLTDRMVFREGELSKLCTLASEHPRQVISYNFDHVDDGADPAILMQYAWSGKLLPLDSRRILIETSLGRFPGTTPRMLNCVVPRSVLDRVAAEFGSVFGPMAPDLSFGYRCLDVVDSTLHYDKGVMIEAGLERSAGYSYASGRRSAEGEEFIERLRALNASVPLPEVPVLVNRLFDEYCTVMGESRSGKFPPLRRDRYLMSLARDTRTLEDDELRRASVRMLVQAGWSGWRRWWYTARSRGERLRHALSFAIHPGDFARRAVWRKRERFRRARGPAAALMRGLRMLPPGESGSSRIGAISYANDHPVERVRRPVGLASLRMRDR